MNPWLLLSVAIAAEITATLSLRASDGFTRPLPTIVMVAGYVIAIWLLSVIVRSLPVGIVYAVWASVGIALIALLGKVFFDESLPGLAVAGIGLIIAGVVLLNLSGAEAH